MADRHRRSRAPSPAVGAALTICCMSAKRMSWQQIAAMTGATNRSHSRRWVSACLRDHGRPAGCRSGDRYQAIRSAPGRSRFGASACSRSATFASLAASLSSVTASHCRRRPFSYHTARHRSPSRRAGYTVIPHSSSTTSRPSGGHRYNGWSRPADSLRCCECRSALASLAGVVSKAGAGHASAAECCVTMPSGCEPRVSSR